MSTPISRSRLSRRHALQAGAALGFAAAAGATQAAATQGHGGRSIPLAFNDPIWNRETRARLEGDTAPGRFVHGYATGIVHAVRSGEAVKPLFGFEVFSGIRVLRQPDGSYQRLCRELIFYKDLKSGELMDQWDNVLTGERVKVVDVANDPFNYIISEYFPDPPSYGGLNKDKPPKRPLLLEYVSDRYTTRYIRNVCEEIGEFQQPFRVDHNRRTYRAKTRAPYPEWLSRHFIWLFRGSGIATLDCKSIGGGAGHTAPTSLLQSRGNPPWPANRPGALEFRQLMTALQWAEHVSPAIVGRGATLSAPREFERTGKLSVRNPRTGVVDFEFIPPTRTVLASIAQRLRGAQVRWATLPLAQRIDAMHGLRRELVARRKELVAALVEDTGRDVVAVAELASTLAMIDRWCALVPRLSVQDETQSCAVDSPVVLSRYVPHPLVGVVSSYQRPLTMALLDAIPALLAGCAVQVMPGESAPRFCFPLSDCIAQVKPLSDVLAIAPGAPDRAEALIEQADVICFNGEMPAAHSVAEYAARHAIPIYTESAGRAPAIVTANVDLDIAARVVARASWLSTGHERQPIERVYVDHRVATAFIEKLVAHATRIRHDPAAKSCGLGLVGPFIRHEHVGSTAIQMADAVARGARVWCGGRIEVAGGHWLSPTIVTDFDRQAQIMRETIYGPLLPVTSFRDLEEAANLVNESPNCRSAAILARTLKEARDFARRLHATSISLNDSIVESAILDTGSYSVLAPGTGCSSTGESAYLRFLRRQILLCTHGDAQPSVLGEPDP